jgi:hypothetical protein
MDMTRPVAGGPQRAPRAVTVISEIVSIPALGEASNY